MDTISEYYEIKKRMLIGFILCLLGLAVMGYVYKAGSFYSKITFDRISNTVYSKGIFGKKEMERLALLRGFRVKTDYKGFIRSLCYNVEVIKIKDSKGNIFPFCISDSAKIKSIVKQANDFLGNGEMMVISFSVFSVSHFIWFLVGLLIAAGGFFEFWRNLKKMQ